MVALLGSHLQGSALEAYNIVAATASEYGLVKSRLLQWFREELDKKANTETSGFTKAVMQEGEDIPLFALRLLGLAQRAFPNNLSLIHISEPTRLLSISYAVFCLKKKN